MARAFSHILLAYDDSAMSALALDYAVALARPGVTLTVAHAVNESSIVASATTAAGFAAIDPTPLIEEIEAQGAAIVRAGVQACRERGIEAEHVMVRDSARAGLMEIVRQKHIDLIVLGTHGRSGIARTFLGSVAESILRASEIPVLVVTGHAARPHGDALFPRALVALDNSDPSHAAMAVAARIVDDLGTHLTLCTVVDSRDLVDKAALYGYDAQPIDADLHAEARQLLESDAISATAVLPIDDKVVVDGEPAQAIEHTAMQRHCELIIMGSHGRTGLARFFLGSVAEAVVRSSAIPVLVVPMQR